jgi:hypothetical protein
MAIYKRGRVPNELAEMLRGDEGKPLDVADFYSIATMHYCADEALEAFATAANLTPSLLDGSSSIGVWIRSRMPSRAPPASFGVM